MDASKKNVVTLPDDVQEALTAALDAATEQGRYNTETTWEADKAAVAALRLAIAAAIAKAAGR